MRFVVDEEALGCAGLADWSAAEEELAQFADLLSKVRSERETIGILSGWAAGEFAFGQNIASILASSPQIDRDLRNRLLQLLDKCADWDEDPAVSVDGEAFIDGLSVYGLGIARAAQLVATGRNMAVLTMRWRRLAGFRRVTTADGRVEMSFLDEDRDVRLFYRSLIRLEAVHEGAFFELAGRAFPGLCFADGLSFRRFDGGYAVRDRVIEHLAALDDGFAETFEAERGSSAQISARLGIEVSIEGKTRGSPTLMRRRDASFRGYVFRCEWHTKLERHRNRIHFFPGDERTGGRILIGLFVRHLPT